jgi:hypothetical protein
MQSKTILNAATAVSALGALALFSGPAAGQGYQQQQLQKTPPAAQQPAPADIDDETVKTFASALTAVQEIQTDYKPRIEQAREPDVANTLQREAQAEMVEAVKEEGLTVQQYNTLAQQLQANPEFRSKVQRAMKD